jgi:hypothetical protein
MFKDCAAGVSCLVRLVSLRREVILSCTHPTDRGLPDGHQLTPTRTGISCVDAAAFHSRPLFPCICTCRARQLIRPRNAEPSSTGVLAPPEIRTSLQVIFSCTARFRSTIRLPFPTISFMPVPCYPNPALYPQALSLARYNPRAGQYSGRNPLGTATGLPAVSRRLWLATLSHTSSGLALKSGSAGMCLAVGSITSCSIHQTMFSRASCGAIPTLFLCAMCLTLWQWVSAAGQPSQSKFNSEKNSPLSAGAHRSKLSSLSVTQAVTAGMLLQQLLFQSPQTCSRRCNRMPA